MRKKNKTLKVKEINGFWNAGYKVGYQDALDKAIKELLELAFPAGKTRKEQLKNGN